MPLLDFRQARADIRLAEVLQLLGWRARARCGAQVRGPCPVHESTSPASRSFSAHDTSGAQHLALFRLQRFGECPGPVGSSHQPGTLPGGAGLVPATGTTCAIFGE
jgi:hypothetical protein